ncbi:MAG: hypothetical protein QJT81_17645 [Candidatus Thiothrix putei]|uniref:Uncharacterized protein n=1 Tax=Candidatus Thiothrix putei TaxID=3080811 RepID=A0AA95KND9_9GAMM|nr:MAG: hypothetical protein QJT81_17645 [Candidatus Thiothrix putei]
MKAKLNLLTVAIICGLTSPAFANNVSTFANAATVGEFIAHTDDFGGLAAIVEQSAANSQKTIDALNHTMNVIKNSKVADLHTQYLSKSAGEIGKLTKDIAKSEELAKTLKTSGKILKVVGTAADVAVRGMDVTDDYKQYGTVTAVETGVLTTVDGVADFFHPLAIASAITSLTIDKKPVTEWDASDEVIQRVKIILEYDLADFVRKPAELIKTLETEDQAHMAYLDAVNAAWTKISKDGMLGYQNRMKKLMAINDPDKFLAEAKVLQQDHMREIDGLIKGLQVFSDTMVENVQPDSNFIRRWYVDGNLDPVRKDKYLAMQDRANTLNILLNKYKAKNKSVSISSDVVDAWLLKQVLQAKIDVELNDAKLFMAAAKIDAMQKTVAQPSVVDRSVLPSFEPLAKLHFQREPSFI